MKDKYRPAKRVKAKFNQACKERRKQFFQAKALYCKDKTDINRNAKHIVSSNYKKEINKQHKLYFRDFANKLRNMNRRIIRPTEKLLMSRGVTKAKTSLKLIPTLS